jgi:hypothetical protein
MNFHGLILKTLIKDQFRNEKQVGKLAKTILTGFYK